MRSSRFSFTLFFPYTICSWDIYIYIRFQFHFNIPSFNPFHGLTREKTLNLQVPLIILGVVGTVIAIKRIKIRKKESTLQV